MLVTTRLWVKRHAPSNHEGTGAFKKKRLPALLVKRI